MEFVGTTDIMKEITKWTEVICEKLLTQRGHLAGHKLVYNIGKKPFSCKVYWKIFIKGNT